MTCTAMTSPIWPADSAPASTPALTAATSPVKIVGDEFHIGRGEGPDLELTGRTVSRTHARIVVKDDEFVLEDLGSSNGTFLNGSKITGAVPLPNGSEVQFGQGGPKVRLEFSFGPGQKTVMIHDLNARPGARGSGSALGQRLYPVVARAVSGQEAHSRANRIQRNFEYGSGTEVAGI